MDPVMTNTTSMTARQVHDDIEQTLKSHAVSPETAVEKLEATAKRYGATVWRFMKRHPFLSMAALATGGVVAASAVGAAELVFGGVLAFAAYKILREGEPPMKVIEELEGVAHKET
jgi:hypothetical protein